jgi:hypothetical protein
MNSLGWDRNKLRPSLFYLTPSIVDEDSSILKRDEKERKEDCG